MILGSIASAGWVVGALLYHRLFDRISSKRLLNLSIALGTVTTAAYLLLFNEATAAILSFCSGFSAMLATVATVTLAADYCPPRSEGFSFAVMMSLINLATASGDIVGSFLFDHLFHSRLAPLIIVSAAFTAFAFVLVPLLRLGDKRQGEPVGRHCGLIEIKVFTAPTAYNDWRLWQASTPTGVPRGAARIRGYRAAFSMFSEMSAKRARLIAAQSTRLTAARKLHGNCGF